MKEFLKPKLVLILITLVFMAGAIAGPFLWDAITHSFAASASHHDLQVFEHLDLVKFVPVGTKTDTRGTYVVFYDPVFDAADVQRLGHDNGTCAHTSKTLQECEITFIFTEGEIAVQGPELLSGATSTLVIIGGTGSYSEAQGQVTTLQRKAPAGVEFEFIFHFA